MWNLLLFPDTNLVQKPGCECIHSLAGTSTDGYDFSVGIAHPHVLLALSEIEIKIRQHIYLIDYHHVAY